MGRILHFGLGNFARAHLLDYTQDAGGWDVVGVSMRSAGMRDGLAAQGFDYTLAVQGQDNKRIDILRDVLVAPENPSAVLQTITDPQVQIISATVTEKGYLFDAADVAAQPPTSFIAFLARGLAQRSTPVTVMSCDNQVANGAGLKAAVERFAQAAQLEIPWDLIRWPNAMVDRITPATTQALREATSDPMAVPTEPFREWVIEDDFAGPRPDWPEAQIVQDVAAHELRKLRMLNGAHSLLAYAGVLKGHEFVHQAVADPDLRALCEALMAEAAETLPAEVQPQAPAYAKALIARFENPHINHALRQIAMDGTQKLPYRFVSTLQARREMGLASPALEAGCAAWVAFCQQECGQGRALDDPKADLIAQACQSDGAEKALLDLVGHAAA